MRTRVVLTIPFLANFNFTIVFYESDFRTDEKNPSSFFLNDNFLPVLFFLAAFKPERFRKQLDQQAYDGGQIRRTDCEPQLARLYLTFSRLSWSRDIACCDVRRTAYFKTTFSRSQFAGAIDRLRRIFRTVGQPISIILWQMSVNLGSSGRGKLVFEWRLEFDSILGRCLKRWSYPSPGILAV